MTLTHYTWSVEQLGSIIEIGFVFVPNSRELLGELTGTKPSIEAECRGMVCFTDLDVDTAKEQLAEFGRFGIAMTDCWSRELAARKVEYVGLERDAAAFENVKAKFSASVPRLSSRLDSELGNVLQSLAVNRPGFAKSFGAPEYAELLDEYAYYQNDKHWAESEWRIMRKHKFSATDGMDRLELVDCLINATRAGIMPGLKVGVDDVSHLVCPYLHHEELLARLPDDWKSVNIVLS